MSRDEVSGVDAEEGRGLVEVGSVIPDADLDIRVPVHGRTRRYVSHCEGIGETLLDPGAHDRGGYLARCEPHEDGARGRDEIHDARGL